MKRLLIIGLAFAALCSALGPRIFIVTDMEGVGGVNDPEEQLLPGQRRFEESRRLLAGELNAAIQGILLANGESEIVVWDGHDGSRSLTVDMLDYRVSLLQGKPTPANYYLSPKAYDGIMFIGQHAMAGAKNGVLAHSQSFQVRQITINGKPVGEVGQTAAIAGYYDIPVIMLSGDQAACDELLDLQPKAVTVAVKRLAGRASTVSLSHDLAKKRILEAALTAVQRIKELQPWKIAPPIEMKFEYLPQIPLLPEGRTVVYRGATVLEAFEAWLGKL